MKIVGELIYYKKMDEKCGLVLRWLAVGLWCTAAAAVAILLIYMGPVGFAAGYPAAVAYDSLVFLTLSAIGFLAMWQYGRRAVNGKSVLWTWFVLAVVFAVAVYSSNFASHDMYGYLQPWCQNYQSMGWAESFRNITNVSNYTPLYNYLLIIFAHLFDLQGCLYAIKFLTLLFSVALAVVMELMICEIRQSRFSYLHLALFLLLPPVLIEFTAWGQCDAIYTTFCLLAFLMALKRKSVPCFVALGVAFAIKLQFLFIVPMIFVLLLIRDENGKKYLSWQYVWIAPLMYVVNLLPVLCGANLGDLLLVYFSQTGYYAVLSMLCLNLPYFFVPFSLINDVWYWVLTILFAVIGIGVTLLLLLHVLRVHRRHPLSKLQILRYAVLFAFLMVYLMPKMLDRFYFVACMLGIILVCCYPKPLVQLIGTMIATAFTMALVNSLLLLVFDATTLGMVLADFGFVLNAFAVVLLSTLKFDEKT